jgi:predicted transcriptional regulator
MTTRSIRIPDDIDERLVAFAAEEHVSVNSAIVRALDEVLARHAQDSAVAAATDLVFTAREELFQRLADS